jgi:hypothetical protein
MRTLAQSFVVTLALGGCSNNTTTSNPPPLDPTPTPATVIVAGDPPPPDLDPPVLSTISEPTGQGTAGPTGVALAKADRGYIVEQGGACAWVTSPECAPGTRCNPPMPQPIVCPSVPAAQRDEIRERRRDGTCIFYEEAAATKCPPKVPCNPPGPERIEVACPDA